MGERLFKPGIRVIDDPLRKRGLRSRPFDAEGVAVRPLVVIDDGVLTSWFLDTATARELNLRTTGHAQRGVSSAPSPGPTNLHLAAGRESRDALIGDIADGFYVTDLIGMGVNQVTGDYSRGASGFWIENGMLSYPVSEVTIAGNLIDMFAGLTPADDLEFRYGTNAPTVRARGADRCGTLSATRIGPTSRTSWRAPCARRARLRCAAFGTSFKSWTKGESSPVSEVDIEVDALLRERLMAGAPEYGWLSEETDDDPARLNARRVWIVDPIDGTRGFIAGLPEWTVVAALVEDGRPIVAALYAPVDEQLFLGRGWQGRRRSTACRSSRARATALEGARVNGAKRRLEALAAIGAER